MKIEINKLVETIVRIVIEELVKLEVVKIEIGSQQTDTKLLTNSVNSNHRAVIDMSNYKSPILTEERILSLDPLISEIIVPKRTVLTPGARDLIKKRNLVVTKS